MLHALVTHLALLLTGTPAPEPILLLAGETARNTALLLAGGPARSAALLASGPACHLALTSFLAGGPVQNPAPVDPTNGSNGVTLLLAYAKWGALIACAGAALASGGLMAVGSLSNRPDHADRGKRALVWSLGADAAAQILGAFGKAFVAIPPVNLGSGGVRNVYAISLGLAAAIAALLLLGQVIRTAVTHDGGGLAQGLTGIGKAALASLLTLTIAATALEAADQLTRFIVTRTFGSVQALSGKIASLVAWNINVQATLILIFAAVGILLTIVLWFELLLRNAAIAVLVATAPIAAAGQLSRSTQGWWPKLAGSAAQLIVLKPVIALVFCLGFSLTGSSSDVETLLSGMVVLILAVIAWPAVARFFAFASIQVGGGAGLGAVLGFAAGRMTGGGSTPAGIEPDEFSRRLEARTMAGLENATARAGLPATAATGTARTAALGPAGLAAVATSAAQRAANMLTGRMEQMAGHAGIPGANPYAQPAGGPLRRSPGPPRRPGPGAAWRPGRPRPGRASDACRAATARPAARRWGTQRGIAATPGRITAPPTRPSHSEPATRATSASGTARARSPPRTTGHRFRRPRHHRSGA